MQSARALAGWRNIFVRGFSFFSPFLVPSCSLYKSLLVLFLQNSFRFLWFPSSFLTFHYQLLPCQFLLALKAAVAVVVTIPGLGCVAGRGEKEGIGSSWVFGQRCPLQPDKAGGWGGGGVLIVMHGHAKQGGRVRSVAGSGRFFGGGKPFTEYH